MTEHEALESLVEAVQEWIDLRRNDGDRIYMREEPRLHLQMSKAYSALMQARNIPPEGLPEAPNGQKWVRHEEFQSLKQSPPPCHLNWSTRHITWWTLTPIEEPDSLEKIAEDIEVDADALDKCHLHDRANEIRAHADRIRALLAKEESK